MSRRRPVPGRHEPADEYVDDRRCPIAGPHEDHYWHASGGDPHDLEDPETFYCVGGAQSDE